MNEQPLFSIRFTLNGEQVQDRVPARLILLDYLRDMRNVRSVKSGCRIGYCGACTVILDDALPVHSCCVFAGQIDGRQVETVDSPADEVAAMQEALARDNAPQCGFCMPGIVMTGAAFLRGETTDDEARDLLLGNICRCGGYSRIAGAFHDAAEMWR